MAQLVRISASDEFGGWFALRPGHTHTKDFKYKLIYS